MTDRPWETAAAAESSDKRPKRSSKGVLRALTIILLAWGVIVVPACKQRRVNDHAPHAAQKQKKKKTSPALPTPHLATSDQAKATRPNVVLIVVDAERADYTGPYGASRPTTPFLDQLAKQGVVFTHAFSSSSWTVPAMFSMFTSLYPREHGITSGGALGAADIQRVKGQEVLPDDAITLAELLKKGGYTTFGVNTNQHLNARYGFAQGFDVFQGESFAYMPYPNLVIAGLAKQIRKAQPSFVWIHYFDPHFPYRPMAPWFDDWNDTRFKTYVDFSEALTLGYFRKIKNLDAAEPIAAHYIGNLYNVMTALSGNQFAITYSLRAIGSKRGDDFARFLDAAYMSEIRHSDDAMEKAFQIMGIDEQTLVIATADHGEEILDHGGIGHRRSLYQELLHIPLVIRLPFSQRGGTVIDTPASIVDIMPTLLELLDLPIPDNISGQSLVPVIEGKKAKFRSLFAEVKNGKGEESCIIDYPWKLIASGEKGRKELYNLGRDPREEKNLVKKKRSRAERLEKQLTRWLQKKKLRWNGLKLEPLSERELKVLKQLGYVQ